MCDNRMGNAGIYNLYKISNQIPVYEFILGQQILYENVKG
jgi:hypothetical protein